MIKTKRQSRFQTSFIASHGRSCWIFRSCNVKWLLLKQNSYDDQEEKSCDREYRAAFRDWFQENRREFLDRYFSFISQVNNSRWQRTKSSELKKFHVHVISLHIFSEWLLILFFQSSGASEWDEGPGGFNATPRLLWPPYERLLSSMRVLLSAVGFDSPKSVKTF